jgi:tetraacyldisaccharide 4'-kinase
MEALRRADAFVITRTELSLVTSAIEHKLREYNPSAPIFRAATIADSWVDIANGEEHLSRDLPPARVVAFCGIGNPRAFWQLLSRLGFSPVECLEYNDHHSYNSAELKRLAQLAKAHGAAALLTTEKDAVNLCEDAATLLDGVKLLWLKIDLRIENETALMDLIAGRATPQRPARDH